jgi:asparagine synthase (glutamine-hydrolysing)
VFRHILELPPGHFLVADEHGTRVQKYWQNDFPVGSAPLNLETTEVESLVDEFRALLIDACKIRLRADVPVGAYLSGGLDSSTLASIVRQHTSNRLVTFSIAFNDESFDESPYQRQMAVHLGTDHHMVRASHEDIGRVFPDVIWHTESPVTRTAPAPMFLLSKLVRETGFKVVLTGEGADEFLAGYDIFREDKIRRFWARQPNSASRPLLLQRLYSDIAGLPKGNPGWSTAFFRRGLMEIDSPWYSHAVRWNNNQRTLRFLEQSNLPSPFPTATLAERLPDNFMRWKPLARAQYLETALFFSQYLLSSQGDRMSMAHSVEGRFPFLDVRLTEFCNRLDPRLKLRGLQEKFLLKKAAEPWLPHTICQRRKRPYRAPIHRSLLNRATADYADEVLSKESLTACGLFKPHAVEQLTAKIKAGFPIGETDEMALAGILSTQLLHHLFVSHFSALPALTDSDRTTVYHLDRQGVSASRSPMKSDLAETV